MDKLKVLIIEDERFLARQLEHYFLSKSHDVVGIASSGEDAIELAREHLPDLLMVDIELEGKMNGIMACEKIVEFSDASIIYLSQFRSKKWNNRIIETRPVLFLTKPFNEHELELNLGLLRESRKQVDLEPMRNYVFLKDKDMHMKIAIKEILFLEAARSSCSIIMESKKITVSMSMKTVMNKLNHPMIARISRSKAVNLENVTGFMGGVLFINQHELSISSDYKEYVMRKLNNL